MEKEIEELLAPVSDNPNFALGSFSKPATQFPVCNIVWYSIDDIIRCASLEMCLTSKYEYIRECKKWFEKNK